MNSWWNQQVFYSKQLKLSLIEIHGFRVSCKWCKVKSRSNSIHVEFAHDPSFFGKWHFVTLCLYGILLFWLVVSEPSPKLAYIIFELESYIGIYTIDTESGALTEKEMVQLLPNPSSTDYAAEIEICSDKKFLYASNRKTDDSNGAIVVFEIQNDGSLERIQVQPVMGSTPRHFKVSKVLF